MNDLLKRLEVYMAAAAFAEANQHGMAKEELSRFEMKRKRQRLENRTEAPRPRPELRASSIDD